MRLFVVLLLCMSVAPLPASEPLAVRGPEIVSGENDAEWQPLFNALAEKGAVRAELTERRWFKVRRQPVELTGEMRLAPDRGLSLHYGDRTVIVDAQGVLLRDAHGRSRIMRPDDRAPPVNIWLLTVLRFDLPALEKTFRLYGARSENVWRLDLVPRDAPDTLGLGVDVTGGIVVHGIEDKVTRLDLRPTADMRIEILLGATEANVTFGPDELQRFFR